MRHCQIKIILILMGGLLGFASQTDSVFASVEETIDIFSGKPCYRCHLSKVGGTGVHSALKGNRCTPCHKLSNGNHQKDHRFSEVKDRTARLCYECHDNLTRQKSVHAPIIDHDCLSCHAAHTSTNGNLLIVSLDHLCFECHEPALMNAENTGQATGFRDGNRNLHYLHARKNALHCLTCHEAHASNQEHLLRTKGGSVVLTYLATATGGNCTSNCHDTVNYSRK